MIIRTVLALLLLVVGVSGCASLYNLDGGNRGGVSSSLVDYLYPGGEIPPEVTDSIPRLNLPLRVGIAFVPGQGGRAAIPEATRIQLLEKVKAAFNDRDYIEHIEVIPDTYLSSARGINGMQQVARIYGVDVMALVSYDQVAVSEDNPGSFLYWTIVGVVRHQGDLQRGADVCRYRRFRRHDSTPAVSCPGVGHDVGSFNAGREQRSRAQDDGRPVSQRRCLR